VERARDRSSRPSWLTTRAVDPDGLENDTFWVDYWDKGLVGTALYHGPHMMTEPDELVEDYLQPSGSARSAPPEPGVSTTSLTSKRSVSSMAQRPTERSAARGHRSISRRCSTGPVCRYRNE
jgi:hypothetical protein